ncbi:sensor histidine kinase [Nonomuraea aurantiaca]|uniref:sensor histidine kinase n=1 Tax=Nonomuraea aurantiaca TaxID=2878562 RepID=UPI001CDA49CD|nr:histidine kinase [Nonomuraea aurantiaca]MCA2228611.1 histidine kinase [Nonomuraea aurantiaca]
MQREASWAGLAFVVGLLLIVGGAYTHREVPEGWLAVPLAFVCAGVVVRQRAPLVGLVLGAVGIGVDLFVGPSLPTVLIFTDNVYAAALYGPAWFSRWLLGVATVLAVLAGAVTGVVARDWRLLAVVGIQAGLVLVTPVTTAMVLRQQREQAAAERDRAEQVARLAELDRQAAIVTERTRMARELHDMIANHFSAIAIQSTGALSRTDLDAAAVRKIIESVRENSLKGLAEMRTMIGLLRQEGDEAEATRPRLADAESLVERSRRAGMAADFRVEGEPRELSPAVDLAGYRILQEALTNALKHGGRPAVVKVVYESGQVTVAVDNPVDKSVGNSVDRRSARLLGAGEVPRAEVFSAEVFPGAGAGLAPGAGTGLVPGAGAGLVGMRERAVLVGGSFEAGVDGDLWRVKAVLPMPTDRKGQWEAG